jgi:hypothetical protein
MTAGKGRLTRGTEPLHAEQARLSALAAGRGLALAMAAVKCDRDHAEEPERLVSRVAKLVKLVRRNQNHLAGTDVVGVDTFFHHPHSALHHDLMFVVVMMKGCVPARRDLKLAHGKCRRLVFTANQNSKFNPLGAWHRDRLPFESVDLFNHDSPGAS